MKVKVGDFVKCPSGFGCPPKFGFVTGEGVLKHTGFHVWIVKTGPNQEEGFLKEPVSGGLRIYKPFPQKR